MAKRIANHDKDLLILDDKIKIYISKCTKIDVQEYIYQHTKHTYDTEYIRGVYSFMSQFKDAELTIDYSKAIKKLRLERAALIKQYELDMLNFKSKFCSKDTQSSKLHSFWNFLTK